MDTVNAVVFAPPWEGGGVKSLYTACEGLDQLGRCRIVPFHEPRLATWFTHQCELYDHSYEPEIVLYPEIYQPHLSGSRHICFVLGKYALPSPHADLIVCRSPDLVSWIADENRTTPIASILPSVNRAIFEYDGRPKNDVICYMTRPHKHPEIAQLLKARYGDKVVEIIDRPEAEVAEILKSSRVFVCRGNDKEGSPRPPKEALVAGCVVVGLREDLKSAYHTDFGIQCASLDELIEKAGEALHLPVPTEAERAVVRDTVEERHDWAALVAKLSISAESGAVTR
ncbi:MAG TPA: hypothetical protein VK581_06790 [Chthoniobacterales bacterium]|nr:hypothetical protein [Chthoniobacterales bacterium]